MDDPWLDGGPMETGQSLVDVQIPPRQASTVWDWARCMCGKRAHLGTLTHEDGTPLCEWPGGDETVAG